MLTGYAVTNGIFTKVSVNQYSDLIPEMVWLDLENKHAQASLARSI
jgi:hypothetical protein